MSQVTRPTSRSEAAASMKAALASGSRPTFADQRVITAEHEAAHVVVYLVTGCGFHYAEIEPNSYTTASPVPVGRDSWTLALVSVAGIVVEDTFRPQPLSERVAEAVDWIELGDDPGELGDMEIFASLPELAQVAYDAASGLLARYADVHAEVADALYRQGHLTRDDLASLPLAGALLEEGDR